MIPEDDNFDKALQESAELREEKTILKEEKEAALQENRAIKRKLQEEKNQGKKNQKLVAELQEKVECPVCLVAPREGPVPCCPVGHIVCSPCLTRLRGEGKEECPTCRAPMGEGESALAKVIIEQMVHQCSLESCEEMVAFKGYKEHQASCQYRLVICPGMSPACNEMVSLCKLEDHAKICQGMELSENLKQGMMFWVPEDVVESDGLVWKTEQFKGTNGVFFFNMGKPNYHYSLEVVMLGSEEDCWKNTMEVSVMGPDSDTADIQSRFRPRPIGLTNDTDGFCLIFKQESLAKIWKYNGVDKRFEFKVSVKAMKAGHRFFASRIVGSSLLAPELS